MRCFSSVCFNCSMAEPVHRSAHAAPGKEKKKEKKIHTPITCEINYAFVYIGRLKEL